MVKNFLFIFKVLLLQRPNFLLFSSAPWINILIYNAYKQPKGFVSHCIVAFLVRRLSLWIEALKNENDFTCFIFSSLHENARTHKYHCISSAASSINQYKWKTERCENIAFIIGSIVLLSSSLIQNRYIKKSSPVNWIYIIRKQCSDCTTHHNSFHEF